MCDFNCVVDPALDVQYPPDTPDPVAKARSNHCTHARTIEEAFTDRGLTDMYRSHAGASAREYTREGSTVQTRLDRFYSSDVNSSLVWVSIGVDSSFGRRRDCSSDHYAVKAVVHQHAPRVTRTPIDRIDANVIDDPRMRDHIEHLFAGVYKKYDTNLYGHAPVWELFKSLLYEMLISECKERRNNRGGGQVAYWDAKREKERLRAAKEGPSHQHLAQMKEIDSRTKAAKDRAHPPLGV